MVTMLAKVKIRVKILSILGLLAGGYILLLAMVQISTSVTHSRMSEISASLFPAALKIQEAEADYERMKKQYGDAVVLQDTGPLIVAEKEAGATADALEAVKTSLAAVPEIHGSVDRLASEFALLRARNRTTYAAIAGGTPTPEMMAQMKDLGKQNNDFAASMAGLNRQIAAIFQVQLDSVDAWSIRSKVIGRVMVIAAVLICLLAWWVVRSAVVLPLRSLALCMRDIAEGDGDLTRRIEIAGGNEIDEVGSWFNVFIGRIEVIMARVASHAKTLGAAAEELAGTARDTSRRASEQKQQAEQIQVSMNEMASAIEEISQTTQNAAIGANRAEEGAKTGGETVQSTVQSIGQVLEANRQTSERIEELGRSSAAIGRIVNVIEGIAGQTNLLALNASIEAARAGENGRGFAVVAGEVRRLAERTSSATKEIDATVHAIQEGTTDTVAAMRASMSYVQTGVDAARSAGDALAGIIEGSGAVQRMVSQIAAAATQQSCSTQSVSDNVKEIAAIIQLTASNSERSVEACQQLSRLARELSQLVDGFRVGADCIEARHTLETAPAKVEAFR
jgi:methyl-accepting chemotaxis protein